MRSNPASVERFYRKMRAHLQKSPDAAAFMATVTIADDYTEFLFASSGATPSHYVALADQALARAIEKMTAMPEPARDLIAQIETARAALNLRDRGAGDA